LLPPACNAPVIKYLLQHHPYAVQQRNHPYGSLPLHLLCENLWQQAIEIDSGKIPALFTEILSTIQTMVHHHPQSVTARDYFAQRTPVECLRHSMQGTPAVASPAAQSDDSLVVAANLQGESIHSERSRSGDQSDTIRSYQKIVEWLEQQEQSSPPCGLK
jgi:hypothetical protein